MGKFDFKENILKPLVGGIKRFLTFGNLIILIILYGIALRVVSFWTMDVSGDGAYYAYLGGSFYENGGFVMQWEPAMSVWQTSLTYPTYLWAYYSIFGYDIAVTKFASILMSMITLAIIYLTSKDLFGEQKALIITAIFAVDSILLLSAGRNYGENILLLLFALTVWALIKGLKDSKYMVLFGIFAGLTFLTKTDIRLILALIGLTGILMWRFYYLRFSMLKDKYFIAGILIILAVILWREIMIESSGVWVSQSTLLYGISDLGSYLGILLVRLPFAILLPMIIGFFFLPEIEGVTRKAKIEFYNILLIIIIGLTLFVWLQTSSQYLYDSNYTIFSRDALRYIDIAFFPLIWIVIKDVDFKTSYKHNNLRDTLSSLRLLFRDRKRLIFLSCPVIAFLVSIIFFGSWLAIFFAFGTVALLFKELKKRIAILLVAFSLVSANALTASLHYGYIDAAKAMSPKLQDGDVVSFDQENPGFLQYQIHPYIKNHDIFVAEYSNASDVQNITFIISEFDNTYNNFTLIGDFPSKLERTILQRIWLNLKGDSDEAIVTGTSYSLWQHNSTMNR
jgi:4-amino-4-deoxy-L-arabinose transferase-like glycosyltransferase